MRTTHLVHNPQGAVMNATENIETAATRTDTGRRHGKARRARNRFAGLAAAAALGAGALLGPVLGAAPSASAAATPSWLMGAGTLAGITAADPVTAAQVLNAPTTYGTGSSLTASPIQPGLAATPVLTYTSYAQFAADVANARIAFPYQWVMYDPEKWTQTPLNEQQDPARYMTLFGQLAHAHGLKVIQAPALGLGYVAGAVTPRLQGETIVHWYLRAGLAAAAAAAGDIVDVQAESQETSLPAYDTLVTGAQAQAQTANPTVQVAAEVSTYNGTVAQMTAAAQSVSPDGYYVAAPGNITAAAQFIQTMTAAGY
jgi:hypothetical protein